MNDYILKVEQICLAANGVYKIVLSSEQGLPEIKAGQFLHLKVPNFNLRRPFCVYDSDKNTLSIYVAIVGKGTDALCKVKVGDKLNAVLPIGNGFDTTGVKTGVILGGGTGCAPLYMLTKDKSVKWHTYLGFKSAKDVMYTDDFSKNSALHLFTDDGSAGEKGFPTDKLAKDIKSIAPDALFFCGPLSMARAAQKLCKENNVRGYMSNEARMGCGIGACLVCAIKTKSENGEIAMKRACVDGPIFDINEVVL